MHQPNYREPGSNRLAMPWVRFHALKDYLDMPLTAGAYESTKVTFNLVPSLLDQLDLYLEGGTDRHLELSALRAEDLTPGLKLEILDTFFSAYPEHMIKPYSRYWELFNKSRRSDGQKNILAALFSSAEMRDLQVLSNLVWVDPMFREEEPIKTLFAKKKHYSDEDKAALLAWQIDLIGRVIPTYRRLLDENRIEISFTPYYHPILPLLCDTNIALESSPTMKLPDRRFIHPEDAERQVAMSVRKFEELFGRKMTGMWPSEGSVSEDVLQIISKAGLTWTATDEEILFHSLNKSGLERSSNPLHTVYKHSSGLKLLFRDHGLSDRIGFVYSGWKADKAVADFVAHLKEIRRVLADDLDNAVIPVILDGENAWEYFPLDGTEFLNLLYQSLHEDPQIELITMSEAAETITARPLPSIFSGSWINHNFRIWIGHQEDNTAWSLLSRTRDVLMQFADARPEYDPMKLRDAWTQIYIAEGSDWCWCYGDEHRGQHNDQFDMIFRRHLVAVYELLGLEIPVDLLRPISSEGIVTYIVPPDGMLTPIIDGRLTHFYEWAGAGSFDCLKAGGAMHRVDRYIEKISFAYDHDLFYIRLDFHNRKNIDLLKEPRFVVNLFTPGPVTFEIRVAEQGSHVGRAEQFEYALDELLEIQIHRSKLWPAEFGSLGFCVGLYEGAERLEIWPETEPIVVNVAEQNKEVFWPL